jgi:hypothetical protein
MSGEKYIGLDVHQATISVAVMDSQGKLIMESILETKASTILEFLAGLRGTLSLTFEEGTWAAWLYDLLKPHVAKLVVCNPRKNALLQQGNKSDKIDARQLADRLRLNDLKSVYHGETGVRMLREQDDPVFRAIFIALLADAPFSAFRWETPPINAASVGRPFEFVLLDSPGLASQPDRDAFAEHFGGQHSGDVVSFPNLNNDAILVVPCPLGPLSAYGLLAAFVREAPDAQNHSLWRLVGELMERRLGPRPIWLSTAGAGVSWLHVRLDQRPKYYGHPRIERALAINKFYKKGCQEKSSSSTGGRGRFCLEIQPTSL